MSILKVIAGDNGLIPYRKELNTITGSVTATILLQQFIYWFDKNGNKPFYKFIEPCNNELYLKGDSWVEELGFSKYEFKTAYDKLEKIGIVSKKINMNRVTFYALDLVVLRKLINSIYVSEECQLMQSENTDIAYSKNSNNAETTTENTSKSGEKEQEYTPDKQQKETQNDESGTDGFERLNGYQKIDIFRARLKDTIGAAKTRIHKSDIADARELAEKIDDLQDFLDAYEDHRFMTKDKQYVRGLLAFMFGYIDGTFKSPKRQEEDYAVAIRPSWVKLEDGNFMAPNGSVMNPYTAEVIPDYWERRAG